MKLIILIVLGCVLTGCVNGYFDTIRGLSTEEVREQMGEPMTILSENNHQMWTYRSENCTQMLFFGPEGIAEDWRSVGTCDAEE